MTQAAEVLSGEGVDQGGEAGQLETNTNTSQAGNQNEGPWYGAIENEELKGMMEAKNWKSPEDMAKSYRSLEQRLGQIKGNPDKLLVLPEEQNAESLAEIYNKLGRPETADGYELKLPESVTSDDPMLKGFKETAHKLGFSAEQAAGLYDWFNQTTAEAIEQQSQQEAQQQEQAIDSLKREWGAAYNERVEVARRAAQAVGVTAEELEREEKAMGTGWLMKKYYGIGQNMKEDTLHGAQDGGRRFDAMSPEEARYKMQQLKEDPEWRQRYLNKGAKEVEEFKRLLQFANA